MDGKRGDSKGVSAKSRRSQRMRIAQKLYRCLRPNEEDFEKSMRKSGNVRMRAMRSFASLSMLTKYPNY